MDCMSLSLDNTMRWFVQADQLEKDGFRTVGELEEYAENTASSLYYLMLECLGENCAPKHQTQRGTCKGQQTYTGKTDIHETLFVQKCAQYHACVQVFQVACSILMISLLMSKSHDWGLTSSQGTEDQFA